MKNNILFKTVLTALLVITPIAYIMKFSVDYLYYSKYIIVSNGDYYSFSIKSIVLFSIIVIPFAIFIPIFLYYFLKPLKEYLDIKNKGGNPEKDLQIKARNSISSLPIAIISFCILCFLVGPTFQYIFGSHEFVNIYDFIITFLMSFSAGFLSSMLFIILSDIILFKTKLLFNIQHPDDNYKRQLSQKYKTILLFISMIFFLSTYTGVAQYSNSVRNSEIAEKIIKKVEINKGIINPDDFKEIMNAKQNLSKSNKNMSKLIFYVSILISIVITIIISLLYYKETDDQLKNISSKFLDMSEGEGNLNDRINIINFDEMSLITSGFNNFIENIEKIMTNINKASEEMKNSTEKLDIGITSSKKITNNLIKSYNEINQNIERQFEMVENTKEITENNLQSINIISENIINQSNMVEESSAVISQMVQNIKEINNNIQKADEYSNNLHIITNDGKTAVENSIQAITEIESSSKEVEAIIEIISEVADKTNLLAMNAAIEAAHAGDAGKGFSVVADEIRKLAESSSDSSKKIIQHIKIMLDKISKGVKSAHYTGETLQKIVTTSKDIFELLREISKKMSEQTINANEINLSSESLVVITTNIKEKLEVQKRGIENIETLMTELYQISSLISNSSKEQYKSNGELDDIIDNINQIFSSNKEMFDKLNLLIKIFKI